ncbi:hypothetical protein MN116_006391 [Schistosoma mekongi]|uniref:Cadherin domain-containing protein n=1 Tax=Schistosoma mekongi TaxID=38744 RepID=A0AAE1ZBW4_SCHME|nr:hypothetical protein MN116_006391 [Schistosoma mekongi]
MLFYINLIQCKMIHLQIDEEISLNTKIVSLLKYLQGGLNNLYFIKVNNSNDASKYFSVNQITGDITVIHRLDREILCNNNNDSRNKKIEKYSTRITEWIPNVFSSSKCELYFSVNCLNTTSYSSKLRTHISNKLIVIFDIIIELKDINDNGCKFLPSDQQIIRIREDSSVNDTRFTLYTPYDPDDIISGNTVKSDRIWIDTNSTQHIRSLFKLHSQSSLKNTTISDINLELELINALDYEKEKIYSFQIVADDGISSNEHECRLNITVLVEDCNDHEPLFEQSIYSVKISENTPIGHLIIQLKASDADVGENGKIIYSFASYSDDTDDGNFFYILSETGEIKLQRRLNHRTKPRHLLKVIAKNPDNTTLRTMKPFHTSKLSTTQVIVKVIDVNDHSPRIRIISPTGSNSLELIEETPPGQDIGIVDVSDGDSGINAQVNCKLTNQTVSDVLLLIPFDNEIIDNDILNFKQKYKLTLQKRVDREEFPFIEFTIVCWDGGTLSLSSNLTHKIKVLDINDHDPVCDQSIYSVKVMEDSNPDRVNRNFEFLTVHATDKDEGRNAKLHFSLDQETPSYIMNLITVNATTGTLSSLGNFDYEKINQFNVTLICSDHGEPERMTKVKININILDDNDNPPIFSQPYYEFTIMENNYISQLIGILHITDNDIGKNAELFIQIEENIKHTHVYLTSLNNHIRLNNDIKELKLNSKDLFISSDLHNTRYTEYIPRFRLHSKRMPKTNITLSNKDSSFYEVKLYIESIIDREELIMKYKDLVSVTYSHYGGFEYITNNYYDKRISEISSITNYSIITPIILLLVSAHDKGIPQLTEYASIRIHILDENDNSPYFIYPDSTHKNRTRNFVSYNEPPGYAFTQVLAIDVDAGENGTILYFIHSGNEQNYFKLNQNNGILSVNKKIPYSAIGEYILRIEARDCGQPYRFTLIEMIIEIDQSPSKAYLTTNIYEFQNSGGIMNFGPSGNTLNLYIIIAIIAAACVISTILLFLVFIFLQRSKRNRNSRTIMSNKNTTKYQGMNMKELLPNWSTPQSPQQNNINKSTDCEVHSLSNYAQNLPSYEEGNTNLELVNHTHPGIFPLPIPTDYDYNEHSVNKTSFNYWPVNNNNNNENNNVNIQTNESIVNLTSSSYNMVTQNSTCMNINNVYNDYSDYHNENKIGYHHDVHQTILNGQCFMPFGTPRTCYKLSDVSKPAQILMTTLDNWSKLPTTDFTSNIILPTDGDSGNGDSLEIHSHLPTKVFYFERT